MNSDREGGRVPEGEPPHEVSVRLTVDRLPGPISGTLTVEDETVEFSGWIELVALIEARRATGADAPESPGPGTPDRSAGPGGPPEAPPEN